MWVYSLPCTLSWNAFTNEPINQSPKHIDYSTPGGSWLNATHCGVRMAAGT